VHTGKQLHDGLAVEVEPPERLEMVITLLWKIPGRLGKACRQEAFDPGLG